MIRINLSKRQLNRIPIANTYLTLRQYRILELYCDGYRQSQIAQVLAMNRKTIDSHLERIKERLGASTLHQAIAIFAASERRKVA